VNAFVAVWRNPYLRVAMYALAAYVAFLLLRELSSVVLLGGLAYLFAYLFHPLVTWLQHRGVRREFGLFLSFLVVVVFLTMSALLTVNVVRELVQFSQKLPDLVANAENQINRWLAQLEQLRGQDEQLRSLIDQATNGIQEGLSSVVTNLLGVLQSASGGLLSRTLGVLSGVVQFFLVVIVGTYMLGSFEAIGRSTLELFPKRWQPFVLELSQDVSTAVGGYIRGQLLIAAAVGTMVGIGLGILGIPLALGLGFLSAVFNIVPYLGVIISIVPALLLASQFGLVKVLLVVLVFVIANQIEANVLSPNILARTTDLHPITVIITILAGASLLGIFGGLLAVPLVALAKLLIRKHWLTSSVHNEGDLTPSVPEPPPSLPRVEEPTP
jgi:predicted PurR-regulated permease PerM